MRRPDTSPVDRTLRQGRPRPRPAGICAPCGALSAGAPRACAGGPSLRRSQPPPAILISGAFAPWGMAGRRTGAASTRPGARGSRKKAAAPPLPSLGLAVLRPRVTADDASDLVSRKKTDAFRTMIIRKPKPSAVRVESVDLYYEATVAASARYAADYYRKAAHEIRVERSVREVVVAGTAFAARGAGSLSKVVPGRGRNTVDIELDEHVYVDNSASVHMDMKGVEIDAPYKGDLAKASEADPKAALDAAGRGRVRRMEADPSYAVKILRSRLQGRISGEARGLSDEFSVGLFSEVYVPVYEARLAGPRRKMALMRIDAIRRSIL